MIIEKNLIKFSDESVGVVLPINLVRYMDLKAGDTVCIKDEKGKKGIYFSVWKKI